MDGSFLEGAGGGIVKGVGQKLISRLFGPALFFWSGGMFLLSWLYGWSYLFGTLSNLNALQQFIVAFVAIILLIFSDMLMEWSTFRLLRWVQGYWPSRLGDYLQAKIVDRSAKQLSDEKEEWQRLGRRLRQLASMDQNDLSAENRESYLRLLKERARLDAELSTYPANPNHLMPTRVGNLLRAAEDYPYERYGLEAFTVWPRLWLVLPKQTQDELNSARRQLDRAIQLVGWGFLFVIWTPFAYWAWALLLAFPIAILTVVVAYRRAIHFAQIYGDFIRAAFDLHRFELYKQMHWPLPTKNTEEKVRGEELTRYIFRGFTSSAIDFEHPSDDGN